MLEILPSNSSETTTVNDEIEKEHLNEDKSKWTAEHKPVQISRNNSCTFLHHLFVGNDFNRLTQVISNNVQKMAQNGKFHIICSGLKVGFIHKMCNQYSKANNFLIPTNRCFGCAVLQNQTNFMLTFTVAELQRMVSQIGTSQDSPQLRDKLWVYGLHLSL